MRGTPQQFQHGVRSGGIIPAYAGNTTAFLSADSPHWDHPRVCGEHATERCPSTDLWGSSPRMRGTPNGMRRNAIGCGIIPAYAGNTQHASPRLTYPGDHPRVCGEHFDVSGGVPWLTGSSPRMRGTLIIAPRSLCRLGIIPAYAGNTTFRRPPAFWRWDHPRVCGEHFTIRFVTTAVTGSSPRMRGTPCRCRTVRRSSGIIPAYAGNT